MGLTADFIRALAGLSAAELPDATIDVLQVIPMAEAAALNYPELVGPASLHYQGYKAITLLGPSLLLSVPESIKDNFNSLTRFDYIKDLIDLAHAKVAEVETVSGTIESLLTVVPPDIDPVTQEGR